MSANAPQTGREAAHGQSAEDRKIVDSRVTTDDAAGAEARSFKTRPGDVEPVPPEPALPEIGAAGERFDPAAVSASRNREQGDGVGERELNLQRDPAGDITEAEMSNDPDPSLADGGRRSDRS